MEAGLSYQEAGWPDAAYTMRLGQTHALHLPCIGCNYSLWCHRAVCHVVTHTVCPCCQVPMSLQAQAIGTEWAAGQQMDPQLLQQMIQQHAQGQPQLQDPNMHLSAPCGHQLQIAQ